MVARTEKRGKLVPEVVAAAKLGKLSKAADYIAARFADYRKKATPEQHATLLEVATHAANLERQTKTKIEAVLHPEKRYKQPAFAKEADPRHADRCEDTELVAPDMQLYGVFDGVSNPPGGEKASADAARVVRSYFASLPASAGIDDLKQVMRDALLQAHHDIVSAEYNKNIATGRLKEPRDRAGTTAAVVKIHRDNVGKRTAIIGSAGDSRVYVRRNSGQLEQVTTDHSMIYYWQQTGLLSEEQARKLNKLMVEVVDPNNLDDTAELLRFSGKSYTERKIYDALNMVAKSLGGPGDQAEPDVLTVELAPEEEIVIVSDGIHDLIPHSTMEQISTNSTGRQDLAQRLLEASKSHARPGPNGKTEDDRLVVVVGPYEDVLAPEIERVKQTYVDAALAGKFLPVPLDVVAREAVQSALVDGALVAFQAALHLQFRDQTPSSVEVAGWSAVGLGDVMDAVLTGEEPTTVTAASTTPEPADPALDRAQLLKALTDLRAYFANRTLLTVEALTAHPDAITELANEVIGKGPATETEKDFRLWLRNSARADKAVKAILTEQFPYQLFGLGKEQTPMYAVQAQELSVNYHDFSRRMLQERQILALQKEGKVSVAAGEAMRQLDYLNDATITAEQGLVDQLTKLADLLTSATLDVAALATNPQVHEIAQHLGISVDAVVETVQAQHAALLHIASQQEKATHTFTQGVKKVAGYLAGGAALSWGAGSAVAALGLTTAGLAPALAIGTLTAYKIYDAYTTVGKQAKLRQEFETRLLTDLKTSSDAYASLADADREASKATNTFKTVLENLAAGLAQRKEEQLRGANLDATKVAHKYYTRLLRDNLPTEWDAKNAANREYTAAVGAGAPADELTRLYKVLLETQAIFNQRAEPYRRMAEAQGSLAHIENDTQTREAKAQKLITPGWLERSPRIAALLGMRADTVSDKLSSVAFFTTMGVIGREHIGVRVAMSAFAGARLADALLTYGESKLTSEARVLTSAALADINPADGPIAKVQLDKLGGTVARTREKLLDQNFKHRKPKEYRELQTTLHVYEQLALATRAQLAIFNLSGQEAENWDWQTLKTKSKKLLRFGVRYSVIAAAALGGGLLGQYLVELAADKAEAELEGTPPPEPAAPDLPVVAPDAVMSDAATPDSSTLAPAAPDAPVASAPDVPAGEPAAAPDLPVTPAPEAAPSTPGPTTLGIEDDVQRVSRPLTDADLQPETMSRVDGTVAGESVRVVDNSTTSTHGTTEQLSHTVATTEGLWHGLRGQGSNAEIAAGLNKTEVVLNGKTVSMMETGVRDADTVSPDLGADGKVHLYDVHDGHQIADSEMDKYLYILKDGSGGHGTVPTPEPINGPASDLDFRTPDLAHDSTASGYVSEGLRDYVNTHSDYTSLSGLSDADLANRPELQHVTAQLTAEYQRALLNPIVPVVPDGGGGGSVVLEPAPSVPFSFLQSGADYVGVTGRLNADGMRELTLGEHIAMTGQVQDFAHFKQDILKLLELDQKRDGIRTANNLVFENRMGILCVDVAGGPKELHEVTPELYAALMKHYQDVVKPDYNGRFDQDEFKAVLGKVR